MIKLLLIALFSILFRYQASDPLPVTPPPGGQLCWDHDIVTPPTQTFEEFIAVVGQSEGVYTNFRPTSPVSLLGNSTYEVNPNEAVELLLQLYSSEASHHYIRYLLLLNEQQITGFVPEIETPYLDVVLDPDSIQTFNLTLPLLEEGIHDVILVGIQDFNEPPESTGRISVFNFRLTLVVGNALPAELHYHSLLAVGKISAGDSFQQLS